MTGVIVQRDTQMWLHACLWSLRDNITATMRFIITYGGDWIYNGADVEPEPLVEVEADSPESLVTKVTQIGDQHKVFEIANVFVKNYPDLATVTAVAATFGIAGMYREA